MGIPLNIDWHQILLHLFNFIILTGGLYFLLYSPIKKFIEKRDAHYRGMDSEANEKLDSARELAEQARERLEKIDQEIQEKRVKAEAELSEYTVKRMKEAQDKADKLISDAKASANEEKRAILDSVDKDIISITKEAAAKILHVSTDEAYSQFLDTAERDEGDGK